MENYFKRLIHVVIFNVSYYVSSNSRLIAFLGNQFSSFINYKIVYLRIVMMFIDKFYLYDFKYI